MMPLIGAEFPKKVAELFDDAKKNIDILTYDCRWHLNQPGHAVQQLNIALVRAVQRGVEVRAVLNRPDLVPTLLKVGVRARVLKDRRTLHAKLILIDGKMLVIGSHNLTRNAFGSNLEASLAVELPEGERRFQDFFNNLWGV